MTIPESRQITADQEEGVTECDKCGRFSCICDGNVYTLVDTPAADRPVENSETWGRAFSDEELSSMQEQGNWNHFEASLFKTCQRLRARSAPVENSELREALDEQRAAWWEYGIWKDSGPNRVTTPFKFDRIEAARSRIEELFASLQEESERRLDALTETQARNTKLAAEISRLRAQQITPEEAREIIRRENQLLLIEPKFRVTTPEIFAKLRAIGEVR